MKSLHSYTSLWAFVTAIMLASPVFAQSASQHKHDDQPDPTSPDLGAELRRLQGKVAELEAALATQHQARYGSSSTGSSMKSMKMGGMGMGMMKDMGGMRGMSQDSDGAMSGMGMMGGGMKGMGMMSMMKGKKGMMGMGMMGLNPAMSSDSMAGMNMPSALPGFPGASHLYHIGETGFFLDHPEHITLSDEQQKKLNEIKESTVLATATAERKVAEAEQDLWKLTAAAEPDIKKIEAKAREIAQLQVENRIAFIRAVGKAAEVLTKEQRQTLVGGSSK